MHYRRLIGLFGVVLLTVAISACSVLASHHHAATHHLNSLLGTDPISGEWAVSFFVHGSTTPATFNLKLEGDGITGTAYSEHTGAGKIRDGKWADNSLTFTLDFAKHESIAVKGTLKDGKLVGEFTTEGFTSNWEASRK